MDASAPQVVSPFPAVDESAPPAFLQVHQEQIAAEPGSFERTQQRSVENIVHVPIPQIQEQFVESIQEFPQERLPERIEEPIENIPIPLTTLNIESFQPMQEQVKVHENP